MSATRFIRTPVESERGIALVMALMIMALMSALMIGFGAVVASDQKFRYVDRDRVKAFYAAQAGLEKLSADLSNLFFANVAPTTAQLNGLSDDPPTLPDVEFTTTNDQGTAYGAVYQPPDANQSEWGIINSGPYDGLKAIKKQYWLHSSVRTSAGGEAYVKRLVETVAIPVFQFGMFSSVDLSFSAAEDFDFGGRVHTNGNLFLAQGGGTASTLTMRDKVTAVGEIVRQRLSNGASIDTSGSTRTVRVATAPNTFRTLQRTEGSVVDGIPSAANTAWPTLSLSTYNSYLRTGKTGAKKLNLPLMNLGDQNINVINRNIDIIKRPPPGEDATNHALLNERFFSKVSLRILLSDTQQDILSLPGVTQNPLPVLLDGNWNLAAQRPAGYGPIDATHPPVALSPGAVAAGNALTVDPAGGNNIDLTFAAVPAYFRPVLLTITTPGGVVTNNVTCTGRNAAGTQFTGCTGLPPASAPINSTVSGTRDGVPVSTLLTVATPAPPPGPPGTTLSVTANTTRQFVHNTFWLQGNLVSCAGNSTTQLLQCDNVPAAAAVGSVVTTGALTPAGTGLIGGFLKIERQDPNGVWYDVTMEILNYGFGAPNVPGLAGTGSRDCGDPTPNAIIRLQRLRDNAEDGVIPAGTPCSYAASTNPNDYWPNTLFDAREAIYRDANPNDPAQAGFPAVRLGGVMHYVALDVRNLSRWFRADADSPFAASTGPQSLRDNGFSVYFSDRRNNRTANNLETGEYGFEDVVNPASATGVPSTTLNPGEDMNGNGFLESYGQFPSYNGVRQTVAPGSAAPLDGTARPWVPVGGNVAKVNRALLFRRALKLVNGGLGNIVAPGLTIASENPVYLQGDWNANQAGFAEPNVATSLLADAVTLLSNAWNDNASFSSPYVTNGRARTRTFYRVAIIAGKGPIFPRPANGEGATFGTDGGVHSFLRFLEGTGNTVANDTVSYRGSMATFFYHRQAISPFKCCNQIVYDVPTRAYAFDVDFLDPALLPPLTPVFRDTNALGFAQEVRPGF